MNQKILVLGAGTAGCAASIFLRQLGFEVTLVERQSQASSTGTFKIGESLSPDASKLLQQLNVWESFCQASHLKCYGNVSYWHSKTPTHHDFLQHPLGHGWHLDRLAFDQMLLNKATDLGAQLLTETRITSIRFENEQWKVELNNPQGSHSTKADFMIDATGRNSWLARQMGIDRLYEAEQLALVAFLNIAEDFEDSRTLVETEGAGWWYAAPIPGNRMVTTYFYPPERIKLPTQPTAEEWQKLLEQSPQTTKRIAQAQGELIADCQTVAAHSSILEVLYGSGWVAIGDAALTYDPISAHGITMAMATARDAANAILSYFKGNTEALNAYESVLWAAFQRYAEDRQGFVVKD
ncbi:hypothetical protein AWW68_15075 [Roseivirga spongicola]|uniref:FAD-binding domain-containing protein n=1 Tax=Roseivirga spongicola TaxID=333140 RepID=A0A150X5M3_9BACT|nr:MULTISPECIES: NAD(P)/FAD-dependent oxidoreductase [Roseivirga]KYG73984.1 hypothetical protein AWW68_15075 [Roseivirga spongicola]MBO6660289.1 NAD(P)/FAD-dependent oxidoreductase [Roseivirga sp.]MBO6761933.1 NAD(P)/FAD-dependent oxidoreductase [Roseivirga sp.]MBO6906974.1 NAD(P)/FAD-dependent oxidoreductase [Roseivirga sp.]